MNKETQQLRAKAEEIADTVSLYKSVHTGNHWWKHFKITEPEVTEYILSAIMEALSLSPSNAPTEAKWVKADRPSEKYPIGTKAKCGTGGHWVKTDRGWNWPGGSTFPTPGGDWTGEIQLPSPQVETPATEDKDREPYGQTLAIAIYRAFKEDAPPELVDYIHHEDYVKAAKFLIDTAWKKHDGYSAQPTEQLKNSTDPGKVSEEEIERIKQENEKMKGTLYSIAWHNPYSVDVFPVIEPYQWYEIHKVIKEKFGFDIDRLSANYGRLLQAPLIEEAKTCLAALNPKKD